MYIFSKIERFNQDVKLKYQLFDSIFSTLPFDTINNTGVLLPLFSESCLKGYDNNLTPKEIVVLFFQKYIDNTIDTSLYNDLSNTIKKEKQQIDLMFRFIQYIERQVVLFDALEDAAFPIINNMEGSASIATIRTKAQSENKINELKDFLSSFCVRTVLTAHPTQFYPGPVLGIITDLTQAIKKNNLGNIKQLLGQLGKTPFIKKEKPTPLDEAISLIWYLENVFYSTIGNIVKYFHENIFEGVLINNPIINLGFWPGGDRDGNPYVTAETTIQVAMRLRTSILKCYYIDIKKLKRKLTFYNIDNLVSIIEEKLYKTIYYSKGETYINLEELKTRLLQIRHLLITEQESLYLSDLDELINKVNCFGYYFAMLDIRQNSNIHNKVFKNIVEETLYRKLTYFPENYMQLEEDEKLKILETVKGTIEPIWFNDDMTRSTIESIQAIKEIQIQNGEAATNRYIISNNESALNVLETYIMLKLSNNEEPKVDIIPLFETIDDLENANKIMQKLYNNKLYNQHLKNRENKQTIMLGFSDGTKDGGYLMANWSIYKAKEALTQISRNHGIKVIFFDGRGGPPARGGGKTNQFYASLGPNIESQEIQLTVQGQTISSNFGTLYSSRYNIEHLLSAGITNCIFNNNKNQLSNKERETLEKLSQISFEKYADFKNHPKFIPYLEKMSTLSYYAKTNIGSRPSKRNTTDNIVFEDLRAIPFVGSWSQLKQNVPGFFGVGTALKRFEEQEDWQKVVDLYNNSLFFKTLVENSMMSLAKSFFPLTSYMKEDAQFGDFWIIIYEEYLETKRLLLKITGYKTLMEDYPDSKASIELRELIVLPLLTIQQYSLMKISELQGQIVLDSEEKDVKTKQDLIKIYQKLVTRSLFGNINASRNSA